MIGSELRAHRLADSGCWLQSQELQPPGYLLTLRPVPTQARLLSIIAKFAWLDKSQRYWAFEADVEPAINPKVFAPEPSG